MTKTFRRDKNKYHSISYVRLSSFTREKNETKTLGKWKLVFWYKITLLTNDAIKRN